MGSGHSDLAVGQAKMQSGQPCDAPEHAEMESETVKRLPYATIYLLCAVIGVLFATPLEQSEFSGGRVTGWLLSIHDLSMWLFVMAAVMTLFAPRTAAAIGLLAVIGALPLYVFFVAPGVFHALFRGEWKIHPTGFFQWDMGAGAALAVLILAVYVQTRIPRVRAA